VHSFAIDAINNVRHFAAPFEFSNVFRR
jgi:hypothetical protein